MADSTKVAISAKFLTAFSALPRQIQGKVTEFINKFRGNPSSGRIHYEKINACKDKKSALYVLMTHTEESLSGSRRREYICFSG